MKLKIINIYNETAPYSIFPRRFWTDPGWKTENGNWIGIWCNNFLNLLGKEILKVTKEFTYEVWQPDTRADRIYSYTFNEMLVHRVFPARYRKKIYGFKIIEEIYSEDILRALQQAANNEQTIIHLHGDILGINRSIIDSLKNIPVSIVFSFHGEINLPSTRFFSKTKNILSKINYFFNHLWVKRNINKIFYITYQNDKNLNHLQRIYKGRMEKITMGCDFGFFKKLDKVETRRELNLPTNKIIMITTANFNSRKQIDKFIEVLIKIMNRYDFLYLLIGKGTEKYEQYLKQIAQPLLKKEMIIFLDYQIGENLKKYLNSADLFVAMATSEGAPVSVMEAFACELPVFSTKTGNTAELMEKEKTGQLVGINEYKDWGEQLEKILETKQLPKVLNRDIAKTHYDWDVIANKFISIYKKVSTERERGGG